MPTGKIEQQRGCQQATALFFGAFLQARFFRRAFFCLGCEVDDQAIVGELDIAREGSVCRLVVEVVSDMGQVGSFG